MIKLGVAYNIFDGEELLLPSIRRMREVAHKIVVVYSNISNFGESNPGLMNVIKQIENESLADIIVQFFPKKDNAHKNETAKRNMGLEHCLDCDVFMTMDCDEFYEPSQLLNALRLFVLSDRNTSACKMQTYYKKSNVIIEPAEEYYVPLFYKVDDRRFILNQKWPVLADPTRKLRPDSFIEFSRDIIEMHHMSYVRNDIRRKLRNSSANINFISRIEEIALAHDKWQLGDLAYLAGKETRIYKTKVVPQLFQDLINIE